MHQGDADQRRHDLLERPGGQHEQQDRADQAAAQRGGPEPDDPPPLPHEFGAVPVHPGETPGTSPTLFDTFASTGG